MTGAWSWWIVGLIVFNLGLTFFLFLWAPRAKVPVLPDGTTGHVWAHGVIREGMHRLPAWWIAVSLAMYIAAFAYFILYPGFGDREGTLRWTSAKEHAEATAANAQRLDPVLARLAAKDVDAVGGDAQARRLGERLFVDNCAACHGREGRGNPLVGAPDLADGVWLHGGGAKDITASIRDGRTGAMPPWSALGNTAVKELAQYVLSLSGRPHQGTAAALGAATFKANCVACHGADGKGNPQLGAPNLTDDVWLWGGTQAAIETTIRDGRQGHMPAWSPRLSDADIHILAGYVHHLPQRGALAAR